MRKPVKFRLLYLFIAISIYVLASYIMPESLASISLTLDLVTSGHIVNYPDWMRVIAASAIFFLVVPILYYYFVIKIGKQAKWKLIIPFSLGCLIARYQYPQEIAQYFEFIMWFRYPIIAVILLIEFYVMVTVIKALWQARKLQGDPRINAIADSKSHKHLDEAQTKQEKADIKKQELALVFAHEPASWYYAIPAFTRNHPQPIARLNLMSAKLWHFSLILLGLSLTTYLSYLLIAPWSQTVALLVATLVFYCVIAFVANYRISKHFSIYLHESKIMINNSWWGFLAIEFDQIKSVTLINETSTSQDKELLTMGGSASNIELRFHDSDLPLYFSGLGMIKEAIAVIRLNVEDPESLKNVIESKINNLNSNNNKQSELNESNN